MIELFYSGGPIFMSILTILLLSMLGVALINSWYVFKNKVNDHAENLRKIKRVRSIGLSAFIIGLLGQLIGLFSAFRSIELGIVDVSPELIAEGFKISMITTLYGLFIFLLSLIIWFSLVSSLRNKMAKQGN
ncbi:MotA/TolQ/ExbB proton channel family protein [Mangrovivirga cuniculi]|uniref:MotA/TolQ/ExbB proton channel domain-containing protein n=1 Tax=Mangrovivirga cuniculi TaxID=2715131 RepID=A0A4D7JRI0_9BACT|nr:MotA/TolQ/ExbB proton channel family protein [Mangrovivirga cuniculi]QCK16130.1 hypothetical protein DCC35_15975 [Mangrovivirga cuniculi]